MQKQFDQLCKNIKLTKEQRIDAQKKCKGVCKKIHDYFYSSEYNGSTKLIFGSYAKARRTAIRPISPYQDVDVLIKIPEEVFMQYYGYALGGQAALLQKIRKILLESRYASSEEPKAWGKIILVQTADGTHNIELLPAFEKDDGTFIIPNSEGGGSWEIFDPRAEIQKFRESNERTNGLTRKLSRMIKRWAREITSVTIKSFEIENYVITFLSQYEYVEKSYSLIVKDFFCYLAANVDNENKSYVETAKGRSLKAVEFEREDHLDDATKEWKKVFGEISFPSVNSIKSINVKPTLGEYNHVEPLKWPYSGISKVHINADLYLPDKKAHKGGVNSDGRNLPNSHWWLKFIATTPSFVREGQYYWQVVNTGEEAMKMGPDGLRGNIFLGNEIRWEQTKYRGKHWVECFIIVNNVCVARSGKFFINIK